MSVPVATIDRFAVISVQSEPRRERLVISYRDEKSLRDFLAEASILALGFGSREEAEANVDRCVPTLQAFPPNLVLTLVNKTARRVKEFVANYWLPRGRFEVGKTPTMIRCLLQHSFAVAIVFIFSKNLFSVAVRAVVSF